MTALLPARAASGNDMLGAWRVNGVNCVDALALLAGLPDNSIELVWIDPPYGNNNGIDDLAASRANDKVKGGRRSGAITPIVNDDYESWQKIMPQVLEQINRVLKRNGCCCCCCCCGGGPKVLFAEVANWIDCYMDFFQAVVWDKSKRGNGLGWRYRRNYEFVMVANKKGGTLRWNEDRPATPNIMRYHPSNNQYHPTEKPLKLVYEFIHNHTYENDIVLDCFLGSGTTAVAARNLGRRYIAGDISPEYCAIAERRLALPYTPLMFTDGELAG